MTGSGDGMVLLCWGAAATVLGGLTATDFRGFARRSVGGTRLWRPDEATNESRLGVARAVGGVFALFGPVALVMGLVLTLHGHGDLLARDRALRGWMRLPPLVVAATWLIQIGRARRQRQGPWALRSWAAHLTLGVGVLGSVALGLWGFDALAFCAAALTAITVLLLTLPARAA